MRFCPFCSAENADELAVCQSCGRRLPPLPPRRARNAPPTGVQLPPRPATTTQAPPLPMRRAGVTSAPPAASPPASVPAASAPPATSPPASVPAANAPAVSPPAVSPPAVSPPAASAPAAVVGTPAEQRTQIGPPVQLAPSGSAQTLIGPPIVDASSPTPPTPASARAVMATSAGFAPLAPGAGLRAPAPRETIPGVTMAVPNDTVPDVGRALASEDARSLANALSPGPAAQRREAPPAEPGAPPGQARRRSDPTTSPPPRAIPRVVPPGARSASPTSPPPLTGAPRSASPTSPPPLTGAPRSAPTTNPPPLTGVPRPAPTTNPPPLSGESSGAAEIAALFAPPAAPLASPPSSAPAAPATSPAALPPAPGPRVDLAPDPPWATGYPRAPVGYIDPDLQASALAVDASRRRAESIDPPPTRVHRAEEMADRPFTPPTVSQVPEVPEPTLVNSARYAVRFARARWQRRGAIKILGADIKKDTDALDQVLGALGGVARGAKVDGRVFSGENAAITTAEERAAQVAREHNDVDTRKLDENAKFVEVERERNTKLAEAERSVDEAQKELAQLEGQRRGLRDARKELERRQKAYLKAAEDNEKQAGATETGDARQDLRRSAEQHRREAAAIEPERQEADRGLAAIERPITEASAKLDAAKAELDAAKRSLADAREGHTHRLAELDAEQKRKAREIAQAEAEIAQRLVTLGTLVNLNRIDDPQFHELYQRIDRLRGAITARTTEIEKLTAEREAYDRGTIVRGVATIGGAILLFIALIVILRAVLVR